MSKFSCKSNPKNLAAEKTCFKIPDIPSCIERFITIPFFTFYHRMSMIVLKKDKT